MKSLSLSLSPLSLQQKNKNIDCVINMIVPSQKRQLNIGLPTHYNRYSISCYLALKPDIHCCLRICKIRSYCLQPPSDQAVDVLFISSVLQTGSELPIFYHEPSLCLSRLCGTRSNPISAPLIPLHPLDRS